MSKLLRPNENDHEFDVLAINNKGDALSLRTYLTDSDNTQYNLTNLKDEVKNILKNRKEDTDKIHAFAGGFMDSNEQAFGFMIGMLTQKIINAHEVSNNTEITLKMEKTEISKEELKESFIESIESLKDYILKNFDDPDFDPSKINLGKIKPDIDGTDSYV